MRRGATETLAFRNHSLGSSTNPVTSIPSRCASRETSGVGPERTETALANPALLERAGVRVALTAGATGGRWLREQAIMAVRYGMKRERALAAVTSTAAELCGLADRGRIEEGLVADLVLWSGHPLLPTTRPLVVVVRGRVIHDTRGER